MPRPKLSVIVPSHFRPLRLRWLLNALYEQTLDRSLWEVCVCHDSGAETEALLNTHPLADDGVLRHTSQETGVGVPASNRNRAWALARADTLVFTDDDCRPPPEWLANVLAAVARHPGAVIQGTVLADPDEAAMLRSPYPFTQQFTDVPRVWAECANIVYPRALLERLGGFVEGWLVGEDTDLNLRAQWAGARYVGDEQMPTYHCIEEGALLDWLRVATRWRDMAPLLARHPELREQLFLGVFWKNTHAWVLVALAGTSVAVLSTVAGPRRRPSFRAAALAVAATLPWAACRPVRGGGSRGRLRHISELPGWALYDVVELVVVARAARREGVLLL